MATSNPLDTLATPETQGAQAVCTAVYAEASVKASNGDNKASCTGVLFIFQQYQNGKDGDVWYAIKNPLDIGLVSPVSATLAGGISTVLQAMGMPEILADAMSGQFVPKFGSDIVRVSFNGGTPKVETDLPDWIGGLLGSTSTNALTTQLTSAVPAAASADLSGITPFSEVSDEADLGASGGAVAESSETTKQKYPLVVNEAPTPSVTPEVTPPNDPPQIVVPPVDPPAALTVTGTDNNTDGNTDSSANTDTGKTSNTDLGNGTGTGSGGGADAGAGALDN